LAAARSATERRGSVVFSILGFIILGIVAGYLGRAIMPGRQKMGFVATAILGMVGSVVGGLLGSLIFEGDLDLSLNPPF
jgi:uncharacterized membrane protein YeaQ/YmgE (transglycosylase-associated protein family)